MSSKSNDKKVISGLALLKFCEFYYIHRMKWGKNKRDEEKAKNKKSQCFHIYFLNNLLKRQKPLSNDKGRKIFEESFVFWLSAALQKTLPYESLLLLNNLI